MILSKNSTFNSPSEMYMCSLFPQKVLELIIHELNPKSVLDVGCGTGKTLEFLLSKKINAIGVENSKSAISLSTVKDKIIRFDLRKTLNLNKVFDVVWCFEVIEHIHPDYEKNFLATLTNHSSVVIISAARPGQGGQGHFNEQEPGYWISRFINMGYVFDEMLSNKLRSTKDVHADNLLCFRR